MPSKDSAQQNVLQGFGPDFEEDFKENQSISIASYSTSQQLPSPVCLTCIQSLHPSKAPDPDYLIVAKESSAPCLIMPLFNNAKMVLGWCWVLKL